MKNLTNILYCGVDEFCLPYDTNKTLVGNSLYNHGFKVEGTAKKVFLVDPEKGTCEAFVRVTITERNLETKKRPDKKKKPKKVLVGV